MDEKVRQQLVDDHFLFVSGDKNLQVENFLILKKYLPLEPNRIEPNRFELSCYGIHSMEIN